MAWSGLFGARARATLFTSMFVAACGSSSADSGGSNTVIPPVTAGDGDAGYYQSGDGDSTPGTTPVPSYDGGQTGGGITPGNSDAGSVGGDGGLAVPPGMLPPGKDYNGWTYVEMAESKCRDGSPAGYYYRVGSSPNLVIFLNGGGACADKFFCGLNPVNVNQDLPIEKLFDGTLDLFFGVRSQRQQPPDEGLFKKDPRNPVGEWSQIYVPYCTGDIHTGVNPDVEIPGVTGKQQFVGYTNFGLFLDSFGPAFEHAEQVLLTGSSAGGFGSLTNFDRVQEFFNQHGGAKVTAITDSGIPMPDKYMAACLQKKWRTYWGIDKIPVMQACGAPCQQADGGGITTGLGDYMFHNKYKGRFMGGAVSTVHDQIIRAFFAPGQSSQGPDAPDDCTQDPGTNTVFSAVLGDLASKYPADKYAEGLKATIDVFGADQVGYYAMTGDLHMHIWRPEYYLDNGLGTVMADWVADILAGKNTKVGSF